MPGTHLTREDRAIIAGMLSVDRGVSCAAIARQIGKHSSTVSRELRRDGTDRGAWSAWSAQLDADVRRRRPKPFRAQVCAVLRREIAQGLGRQWSPEQISGRLKRDFPDRPELHMSHTAIYRSVYILGRSRLLKELDHPLRRGGQTHRSRGVAHSRIKGAVPIGERPSEADARLPGHWEGDLLKGGIKGSNGPSAIATLVERHTRFTLLVALPDGWKSDLLADALAQAVRALPAHLWQSLTWDRGTEMAAHAKFTIATGIQVYFADPHSPWQRGSNENTNGLLRQYFPKGTDLSMHTPTDLAVVAAELNGRPRQTLAWKTSAEALNDLLSAPQPTGDATTT